MTFQRRMIKRVKQVVIDMMVNFKYSPIWLGKELLKESYNKIDGKWKWALTIERQMRVATLS